MKILALGNIRVYEKRGSYQLDCIRLVAAGRGELQLAFERLKERLYSEGLFDAEHKKPIPEFPQQVGVITSPTGAAIRDILQVMRAVFPASVSFCDLPLCRDKIGGGPGKGDRRVQRIRPGRL
jgi:exodeoxyribonuclease VII large subunit